MSDRDAVLSGDGDRTRATIRQSRTTNSARDAQSRQDEELHLLASRRRLLARDDWLALDHTRPLRIGFPTAGDKDRVGRRRKIKNSSATRTKAAQQRLVTPLFEEHLKPNAYLMSGALSPEHEDHVEIRVGTGAFDSQSRPSRRSNTSRNASMAAHSTALSCLSEESMLLGADGDTFDADQVEVPAYIRNGHEDRETTVRPTSPEACQTEPNQLGESFSRVREHSLTLEDGPGIQQYRTRNVDESLSSIACARESDHQVIADRPDDVYAAPGSEIRNAHDTWLAKGMENIDTNVPVDPHIVATSPDQEDALAADTEQAWRRLMGIQSESYTSKKALDSSSEHMSTSETTQRVDPDKFQCGAGVRVANIDTRPYRSALDQSRPTQAPDKLATSPQRSPHSNRDAENNTDNEALWREFIIGSQDSESGDELHSAWQRSRQNLRKSSEQPQSPQVSGLGTSDQATRGEATVCSPSLFATQTAPMDDDHDSIEESELDDTPPSNSPRNIHTTAAKRLDPKRFKLPRESKASAPREVRQEHVASRRYSSRRFTRNMGRG